MDGRTEEENEPIDRKTNRSICKAVAEGLRESLGPEPSHLSSRLRQLMDELRRRDEAASVPNSACPGGSVPARDQHNTGCVFPRLR
jgi:hypothetical protein